MSIDDSLGANGYHLPARLDGVNVKAGYAYAPVHYSIDIDHLSFRASSPQLDADRTDGKIAVREDNLYVEQDFRSGLPRARSAIDGVIEEYLRDADRQGDDDRPRVAA